MTINDIAIAEFAYITGLSNGYVVYRDKKTIIIDRLGREIRFEIHDYEIVGIRYCHLDAKIVSLQKIMDPSLSDEEKIAIVLKYS